MPLSYSGSTFKAHSSSKSKQCISSSSLSTRNIRSPTISSDIPSISHSPYIRTSSKASSAAKTSAAVLSPVTADPHRLPQQDALETNPDRTIKIFYKSGWDNAILHFSVGSQGWRDAPFTPIFSGGSKWLIASIDIPLEAGLHSSAPLLEFVVTNGRGDWDKPPRGSNYAVVRPGRYILNRGEIHNIDSKIHSPDSSLPGPRNSSNASLPAASPSSSPPAVLVVSDLDGTMVGNDAYTSTFRDWWEKEGLVRGGVLAFNTGRTLPSVEALLREKAGFLAVPDVIISAVGTKIYEKDPSSKKWIEMGSWTRVLDEEWSLEAVRDATYRVLASVGREAMHFRPPEELNEHKVTCGVRDDVAGNVVLDLEKILAATGVSANVISSGHGGWKYVDIVPIRAGKLEALDYVRRRFGFPSGHTVACGDSGNDILMLNGLNRAVAVGNSQPDLKTWVQAQPKETSSDPISGGVDLVLKNRGIRLLQAQRPEALGILEALEFWGFK